MAFQEYLNNAVQQLGFRLITNNTASPFYSSVIIQNSTKNFALHYNVENDLFYGVNLEYDILNQLDVLFYNNIWPASNSYLSKQDIMDFINEKFPDRSPMAKVNRLLLAFKEFTAYDGEYMHMSHSDPRVNNLWKSAFLSNPDEFHFYFNYLIDNDFIVHPYKGQQPSTSNYTLDASIKISLKGLEQIIKVQEVQKSKTCFVAMSYDEEMFKIYDSAISLAIKENDFIPELVNEKAKISQEQTLNDAILAAIKKSKFTIADFTNHRPNVYFEAGYALGRGQKVIYTCRKDRKEDVPFDLRNYPIILWETAEDLKEQLKNKIEVDIKS